MSTIKFASIIVTYRCNARCHMCNTWQYPTDADQEIGVADYEKLPFMNTVNVTGGEAFLREDLDAIVSVLKKKSRRVVISSNGFYTEKIVQLFSKHRDIGIRISIEGLPAANDELRGLKDGFDHGIRSLLELHRMGIKDIGFGITVSDRNAKDLLELYELSRMMGLEFATAAIHNAFYFHKSDNMFEQPEEAVAEFKKLIREQLKSRKVKEWFRAYFNYGLINFIEGKPRLLPCNMGHDSFFLDPYGEVYPCNVMQESMGNIRDQAFSEIWNSPDAEDIRRKVKHCTNNCWMIGSVSQQMKKNLWLPARWILQNKFMKDGE
ncbi:radical SAM/SPASM domain-containing protein [Geomobilimonas luticola]|uniref:Radical SAM protein n=1 Tax=Geomobilimonas luticola TaxID=1114878 RepID=A0ABS5SEW5_9BACT|nr:radical SAM protein [Geomobilimonas luticola]MBT0653161.1 radical SAM protein [Geomobilimonas luticola]